MDTNELADAITTALVSGDTYEVDGETWAVEVLHDYNTTINDFDCYGKVSKYAYDYCNDGHTPRPDGFTGRAMKIQVDRGLWMWWEPPVDDGWCTAKDWNENEGLRRSMISMVRDLLEGGFMMLHVTRRGDSRRRDIDEYLGGCDAWELATHSESIYDMVVQAMESDLTDTQGKV